MDHLTHGEGKDFGVEQSHGYASHGTGDVKLDARKTVIIRNNRFEDYSGGGIDKKEHQTNHIFALLFSGFIKRKDATMKFR